MNQAKLAILPLLLSLSACATVEVGRDFDMKAFDARVQRGVTTQAEVRAWLGAPAGIGAAVESTGDRYQQWTYYYGEGRWPALKGAGFKMLQVKFDERGVVRAYNWSGDAR
jgi:hypothetical protein